ncbi:MAG TPA: ABC transporter ATP-binding protein [Pseudohongiella sp.]|nr:ABC transporter ATP-binding protein [Pseudohongiella sp.]
MQKMAIVAENVVRRFGQHTAVDGLNLHIPRGSIYGFLGPNGCGKSTSIRMLTGLLTPDSGHINVLGLELPRQAEALKLRIGYMTQKFSLFSDLTLKENLLFMARIYGLPRSQRRPRVDELLEQYELMPMQKQLAGTMSGGQKQRLALAAATLHKPELLFLDEPTSAVDPENRRDFWEKLFDLSDAGTTVLVSTHYMDEAERCHYLAILDKGKKCADGPPAKLMQDMHAHVLEIDGPQLRQLKRRLLGLPNIRSVAQQGVSLRVLVDNRIKDPDQWLLAQAELDAQQYRITQVRPSLEDVFVTSTGN